MKFLFPFLLLFPLTDLAAQPFDEPLSSVYGEAFGLAREGVSFNYDVRYPRGLGFRLGMTVDPRDPQNEEDYSLFALGHGFLGEGAVVGEIGAGPQLRAGEDVQSPTLGAAGYVGLRLQPIFEAWVVRAGYSPAYDRDGYSGFFGVSLGRGL